MHQLGLFSSLVGLSNTHDDKTLISFWNCCWGLWEPPDTVSFFILFTATNRRFFASYPATRSRTVDIQPHARQYSSYTV